MSFLLRIGESFNTQPPEGGCLAQIAAQAQSSGFNTQPPEGGCRQVRHPRSTRRCFNTQPPEGGCRFPLISFRPFCKFQHTAARRRLRFRLLSHLLFRVVSTHSRPKAAASSLTRPFISRLGFNTQPPEGGCAVAETYNTLVKVSTHSRPKAAAFNTAD